MSSQHKQYDPGTITKELYYFGDEDIFRELNLWALKQFTPSVPKSIRGGSFSINTTKPLYLHNILFDTGAIHRSYINKQLIEENRSNWSSNIYPSHSRIKLGDQQTIVESTEEIMGTVSFIDNNNNNISANINLVVHDMPGMDIIIGLPDISQHFIPLLNEMLTQDTQSIANIINDSIDNDTSLPDAPPNGYDVWSSATEEGSEEEVNTEVPSSFSAYLNFMEMCREDALDLYNNDLANHIGPMLKSYKKF